MNLTQQTALVAAVNADPSLLALVQVNGWQQIADAMNALSAPAVTVWLPSVPASVVLAAIAVADMPASASQLGYLQMLLAPSTVDATSANVRGAFGAIFSGKTTLANLTTAAQRTGTRFETLTQFLTAAAPANVSMSFGYMVSAQDVRNAFGE